MRSRIEREKFFEKIEQLTYDLDQENRDRLKFSFENMSELDFVDFLERDFSNKSTNSLGAASNGLCGIFSIAKSYDAGDGVEKLCSLPNELFNQLCFNKYSCFATIATLPQKWIEICLAKLAQYPEKKFRELCLSKMTDITVMSGTHLLALLIDRLSHDRVKWEKKEYYSSVINRLIAIPQIWQEALFYCIEDRVISGLKPEPTLSLIFRLSCRIDIHQPLILSTYQLPLSILKKIIKTTNLNPTNNDWLSKGLFWLTQLKTYESRHKKRISPLEFAEINIEMTEFLNKMNLHQPASTTGDIYLKNFLYFALSELVTKVADSSVATLKLRFSLLKEIGTEVGMGDPWLTKTFYELASHYFNRGSNYGLFGRARDLRKAISYAIKACLSDFSPQNKFLLNEIINSYLKTNNENMYFIPKAENNTDISVWIEKRLTKLLSRAQAASWESDSIDLEAKINEIITALTQYRADIQVDMAGSNSVKKQKNTHK